MLTTIMKYIISILILYIIFIVFYEHESIYILDLLFLIYLYIFLKKVK